jgi:hypothetical protein
LNSTTTDCVSNLLFLEFVPARVVRLGLLDIGVDHRCKALVVSKVIVKRPLGGGVDRGRIGCSGGRIMHLARQPDDLGETTTTESSNLLFSQRTTTIPLDLYAARKLVTPFYDALTRPGDKDVEALINSVTSADFQSCGNDTIPLRRRKWSLPTNVGHQNTTAQSGTVCHIESRLMHIDK